MTSVKEFRVDEPATADSLGRGRFVFTDAYSVFDWGQMPDAIPRKGASLCAMGAFNFELLETRASRPTTGASRIPAGTLTRARRVRPGSSRSPTRPPRRRRWPST